MLPGVMVGQSEVVDTIEVNVAVADMVMPDGGAMTLRFDENTSYSVEAARLYYAMRSTELGLPDFGFSTGQASVFRWRGGELVAAGATVAMPGLMGLENGSLGVAQHFGNFSVYGGGIVNKYGYFRGLHTQYGLNGSVSYRFSPRLSVTGFGTYYFGRSPMMPNGLPLAPSMAGYYGVSTFGGYVDMKLNDRFGVEVGGQTVQQIGTRRYEPEPIVTPYVNVGSGKTKVHIGLPVGQIIYGILRSRR